MTNPAHQAADRIRQALRPIDDNGQSHGGPDGWMATADEISEWWDSFHEAANPDALRALLAERDEMAKARHAAVDAHEAAQRAGFSFRDELFAERKKNARLRDALEEVCRVLETNTTAIVDTVWVSDGPETLLDYCRAALTTKD